MIKISKYFLLVAISILFVITSNCSSWPLRPAKTIKTDAHSNENYKSIVFGAIELHNFKKVPSSIKMQILYRYLHYEEYENPEFGPGAFLSITKDIAKSNISSDPAYIKVPFVFETASSDQLDLWFIDIGKSRYFPGDTVTDSGKVLLHEKQHPFIAEENGLTYIGTININKIDARRYEFSVLDYFSEDKRYVKKNYPKLYNKYKNNIKKSL